MNRNEFNEALERIKQHNDINLCQFPTFSFGNKEYCQKLLRNCMMALDKSITEFVWLKEYDFVADYLHNTRGKGLFLSGSVGRGKSLIIEKVIPLIFMHRFNKVVNTIDSCSLGKNMSILKLKKFIAIDDVGTEGTFNEFGNKSEPFAEIINNAERNSNIVFSSTNLNKEHMLTRYGERTLDRVKRLCYIVKFEGTSLRR